MCQEADNFALLKFFLTSTLNDEAAISLSAVASAGASH